MKKDIKKQLVKIGHSVRHSKLYNKHHIGNDEQLKDKMNGWLKELKQQIEELENQINK